MSPPRREAAVAVARSAEASSESEAAGHSPTIAKPVTIVFTQQVRRGPERAYRDWVEALQGATRGVPGFLGASTVGRAPGGEYISLVRFDSTASLLAWEQSTTRREWIGKLPPDTIQGVAEVRRLEGVEFWFTPLQDAPAAAPSPHRMALLLVPVVFALTPLLRLLLGEAPPILLTLVMVVLQVGLMTCAIMPRVTRALAGWLFRRGGSQHAARYGRVLLTRHAEEEADSANVQARDIEHAIRTATRAFAAGGKVRLEGGTDLDGGGLVVIVCEIQCGLRIITVF